jgi:polysaccharide pyruvyl transferase WcaK-like protein
VKWSLAAKLAGCRVVLLSVGAGPLHTGVGRLWARIAVALADYRSYRDPYSRDLVAKVTGRRDGLVYPDLAYSYIHDLPTGARPAGPAAASAPGASPGPRPKGLVVAFSPMIFGHPLYWPLGDRAIYQGYARKLAEVGVWLIEKGYILSMFPSQFRMDPIAMAEVKRLMAQSLGTLPGDALLEPEVATVPDLLGAISRADIMVASRFHGVVLPILLHRPVLALSYGPKTTALMTDAGLPEFCLPMDAFTPESLKEAFLALEARRAEVGRKLGERAAINRGLLEEQYDRVFGRVG